MSPLLRRVLVALVALVTVALPRTARAAMIRSYDIASLAYEAQEVVLVEKVKDWKIDEQLGDFERVRVKRSYAGSALHEGDEITIETSCYGFEPIYGWGDRKPKPKVSNERVLFLNAIPANAATRQDPKRSSMDWGLVGSGMRIFVDGRVYRFAQEMNPGCLGPIPGEGPRNAPYTRDEFEVALRAAIATARDAQALLASPPSRERTEKLVAIVGPPADASLAVRNAPPIRDRDFGSDRLAAVIVARLASEKDIDGLLEALARTSRVDLFMTRIDVPAERLAEAARNTSLPTRQRVAALQILGQGIFMPKREPSVAPTFTALLGDAAGEVRLTAVHPPFSDNQAPKAFIDKVVEQFRVEPDARVRYALFRRARQDGVVDRLAIPANAFPLARGVVQDGGVSLEWAVNSGDIGWADEIVIELRRSDRLLSRETIPRDSYGGSSTGGDQASVYLRELTVPQGLAPGVYDVHAEVKIAYDGKAPIVRKIDIGPLDLGPRPEQPTLPVALATVDTPPDIAAASDSPDRSTFERYARRLALHPVPLVSSGAALGLLLGIFVVRRLRRARR